MAQVGNVRRADAGVPDSKSPNQPRPAPSNRGASPTHFGFNLNRSMAASVKQADVWPDKRAPIPGGLGNEDVTVSGMKRPIHTEGGLAQAAASLRRVPDDNTGYFESRAASVETQAGLDTAREEGGSGTTGMGSGRPPAAPAKR